MHPDRIDDNNKQATLGRAIDLPVECLPFLVDPATNMLLIEVIPVSDVGTLIPDTRIRIDDNDKQCSAGVSDDANEDIIPLTVTDVGAPVSIPCLRVDII